MRPSADLRLRSELESFSDAPDRWRMRLRMRAGGVYRPDPRAAVGVTLSTGSASPTSSQLTLGDGFGRADLRLAEAYAEYAPTGWSSLRAGKVPNPIRHRRLVWDRDVRPDGLSETVSLATADDAWHLDLVAGQYVLLERDTDSELYLLTGQVAGKLRRAGVIASAATTFYAHPGIRDELVPYSRGTNSTNPDGTLQQSFHVAVGLVELTWRLPELSLESYVEAARNLGTSDDANAIAAGGAVEPDAAPVELAYEYRRVERDAILDSLAESSWHDRRTGFHGHKLKLRYDISRSWRASSSLKYMRALDTPRTRHIEWLLDLQWSYRS